MVADHMLGFVRTNDGWECTDDDYNDWYVDNDDGYDGNDDDAYDDDDGYDGNDDDADEDEKGTNSNPFVKIQLAFVAV